MGLKNLSKNPRFTRDLISTAGFKGCPVSIVDVGSRGGFEQHWHVYKDQIEMIGFEADVTECQRLNSEDTGGRQRYFPFALFSRRESRPFYITAYPASSGFYPADSSIIQSFPDKANLAIVDSIEISTLDLDTFVVEQDISNIDFIKLDTEGAELEILKGAQNTLAKSVLGLSLEVWFQPWHVGQALFSEIDSFLRGLGYRLFDIATYRINRETLPDIVTSPEPGPSRWGQVVSGDALYLRDGAAEMRDGTLLANEWNDITVLKLASFMEIFGLPDCAAELIKMAGERHILEKKKVSRFLDLLIPEGKYSDLSYSSYMQRMVAVNKQGHDNGVRRFAGIFPTGVRRNLGRGLLKLRDLINAVLGED